VGQENEEHFSKMNDELEKVIHKLKNMRTVQDVLDHNLKRLVEISNRSNEKIKSFEQQIDQIVKKGG